MINYFRPGILLTIPILLVWVGTLRADALLPDDHAPIGVMRDHVHAVGEWMLSYRYMYMDMGGNRIGTRRVSVEQTRMQPNRFMMPPMLRVVPTRMRMEMHMFGAMYAVSDRLTLMAMGNWQRRDMDHRVFLLDDTEGSFKVRTSGFGDARFSLMYGIHTSPGARIQANMGVRLPTGSITKRHRVLTPRNTTPVLRVPYAMQLGTGTFDLLPGLTYSGRSGRAGWGMQYDAELRMGTNDEGYAFGDKHGLTAWGSYRALPWLSVSLRLKGSHQGRIQGEDMVIEMAGPPIQTADPDNYGGRRLDLVAGVNLAGGQAKLHGHRVAVEAGWPFYQDLNGPQMETDFTITAGWQYSWGP